MKLTITGKNLTVSEAIEAYAKKKIGKLDRFFGDDIEATVRLSLQRGHSNVEVTIPIKGDVLRAEESTSDMYASIDGALSKIDRQLRKYRTRFEKRTREGVALSEEYPEVFETQPSIVRTKRFGVEPISVNEAASQMEMLGHTFFAFLNEETMTICVVYRRGDGDLGLLIPELL
jgi:putative sigma-54 modulation protein